MRILQQLRRFLRLFRKTPEIQSDSSSSRSPQVRQPRQLERSLSVEAGLQELKTNNPESRSQGL